jgi:hypothetical protein
VSNAVGERLIPVKSRAFVNDAPQAKFQLVLQHRGKELRTDLPISASELPRLSLEASLQDVSIVEVMGRALAKAIKMDMIQRILG